jgi:NAD+ synthase (glutamine-hydrolysing)
MFDSPYSHGFLRVAVCTPRVEVAAPARNVQRTIALARRAAERKAALVLFPELGLSAYSNEDLVLQDALLDGVESAIHDLLEASRTLAAVLVVGAPLRTESRLFNCALVVCRGQLLGVIPKTYLPNYREFYEKRQFTSGSIALSGSISVAGQRAPFGNNLIFESAVCPDFALHVEICEDVWVPLPPSTYAALGGATVLANLSASNVTIGKADYRRLLCTSQSAKCIAAYLYSAAGYGESTTDLAWDGQSLICENGEVLAESRRFSYDEVSSWPTSILSVCARSTRMTSFSDSAQLNREPLTCLQRISFTLETPDGHVPLERRSHAIPTCHGRPLAQ